MTWVFDGQLVYFVKVNTQKKVPLVVVCAMGKTARVVNEKHKLDTWVDVDEIEPFPREEYDS
jgi:hypothetical protein